jgi:hypothetical protein
MSYKTYFKHPSLPATRHLSFTKAEVKLYEAGKSDEAIRRLVETLGWTIPDEFVVIGNVLMSPEDPKFKSGKSESPDTPKEAEE